jgi:hypothetical protein
MKLFESKGYAVSAIIFVLVAFIVASSLSYEDELAEQNHYCKMVEAGHWPNYKKVDCNE